MTVHSAKLFDTNVPIIADGNRSPQASRECVSACIEMLRRLIAHREFRLVVDLQWIILGEYSRNLGRNQGGLGNEFLKWVLTNYRSPEVCILVRLTHQDGDTFAEFPNESPEFAGFDPADRKWIAAALACSTQEGIRPAIVQGGDTAKWLQYRQAFEKHQIQVDFICLEESDDPPKPKRVTRKKK